MRLAGSLKQDAVTVIQSGTGESTSATINDCNTAFFQFPLHTHCLYRSIKSNRNGSILRFYLRCNVKLRFEFFLFVFSYFTLYRHFLNAQKMHMTLASMINISDERHKTNKCSNNSAFNMPGFTSSCNNINSIYLLRAAISKEQCK